MGVGIHHEGRLVGGVEEDAVGGFGSDSPDAQEFFPQLGRLLTQEPAEVSLPVLFHPPDECLELLRLLVVIPGRADQ